MQLKPPTTLLIGDNWGDLERPRTGHQRLSLFDYLSVINNDRATPERTLPAAISSRPTAVSAKLIDVNKFMEAMQPIEDFRLAVAKLPTGNANCYRDDDYEIHRYTLD